MLSLIDKALQAVLKMLNKKDERVLVWENASPKSKFGKQTVDVDLTGLVAGKDLIEIEAIMYANSGNAAASTFGATYKVADQIRMSFGYGQSGKAYNYYRGTMGWTESSINFGNGYVSTGSSDSQDDFAAVPLRIYKIISGGGQAS